ncbi:MAG TPA: hypothetical protein EYG99_00740 [Candidatus Pacebacteria bacterium]|nr:hypothetical protein [Candidatus Paceibacterota bacterium]
MFDKIEKKVDNIREQPEHIRMRYVWLAVGVTMFLIIFIWLVSLRTSFLQINTNTKSQEDIDNIKKRINELDPNNLTPIKEPISIDELLENNAAQNEM